LSYELSEFELGIKTIEPHWWRGKIGATSVFATHPAYEALTNKFMAMLAPDKAATTSEQIAEAVYGAANDDTNTLKYVCGDDAKEWCAPG
jgi:hypothetical protein